MQRAELKAVLRKWVVSRMKRGDPQMEIKSQLWTMAFGYISYHPRKHRLLSAEQLHKRLVKGLPTINRKEFRKDVMESRDRDDRRRRKGY